MLDFNVALFQYLSLDLCLVLPVCHDPWRLFPFIATLHLCNLSLTPFNHHFCPFNAFNGHNNPVPRVSSVRTKFSLHRFFYLCITHFLCTLTLLVTSFFSLFSFLFFHFLFFFLFILFFWPTIIHYYGTCVLE
jgi:hypothetical protein